MAKTAKTKDDPFAEFEDWLVDGPAGRWPYVNNAKIELNNKQIDIVERNVRLFLNREKWEEKISRFEAKLSILPNEQSTRNLFSIHFDKHEFNCLSSEFRDRIFPCSVSFANSKFLQKDTSFKGSVFKQGTVSFRRANFGDGFVSFSETTFDCDQISFYKTCFGQGDLWFRESNINSHFIDFSGAEIDGNLYFSAHIQGRCDFQKISVGGSTVIRNTDFNEVPDFRDAEFSRPPEVANMVVPDAQELLVRKRFWQLGQSPDAGKDENEKQHYVSRYRKLKAMALAANDHEKDGEFFSYEMLAKRGVETTTTAGLLFNTLYYRLSNFGQSFTRPLGWMVTSLFSFAFVYYWIIATTVRKWDLIWFPLELSFRNFLPLFGSLFRFAVRPADHKSRFDVTYHQLAHDGVSIDYLVWLGVVQNTIGTILLFLFLLALRNKFRLK